MVQDTRDLPGPGGVRAYVYRDGVQQTDEYREIPESFCPRSGMSFAIWITKKLADGDVSIVISKARYDLTPQGMDELTIETPEGL